jgi:hypothetical protein
MTKGKGTKFKYVACIRVHLLNYAKSFPILQLLHLKVEMSTKPHNLDSSMIISKTLNLMEL